MSSVERLLEERAQLLARPLAVPRSEAMADVVCFEVGNERFAIEAAFVQRLVPVPRATALPGTPAHLSGIANVRGQLLPVFDLIRLLELPATAEVTQLVVVGRTGFELGLLASAVTAIVPLVAVPRGVEQRDRSIVQRVLPDGRALIDAAALLDDPRLAVGPAHSPGEDVPR